MTGRNPDLKTPALDEPATLRTEFFGLLAHELRNCLTPIDGAVQLLKLMDDMPDEADHLVESIGRQLMPLSRLIDDLADLSCVSRNRLSLKKRTCSLREIVSRSAVVWSPICRESGHELTVELDADELMLDGDEDRLNQVLANLLVNAIKYTPRGGRIWLSAIRQTNLAVIRVRDEGIGIPEEKLPDVFDMFMQLGRIGDRSSGMGVGLSLAKSLVEMHGGAIEVTSDGDGRGSQFVVRLPLVADCEHFPP